MIMNTETTANIIWHAFTQHQISTWRRMTSRLVRMSPTRNTRRNVGMAVVALAVSSWFIACGGGGEWGFSTLLGPLLTD
jgi:hypothetical protein